MVPMYTQESPEVPCRPAVYLRGAQYAPNLVFAPGPEEIGVTGNGSLSELFGYAWVLCMDNNTRVVRLFQLLESGQPYPINSPAPPAPSWEWVERHTEVIENAGAVRRVSFAFDNSAQPIVAFERQGYIWAKRWDPSSGWEYIGPWAGTDPVAFNDAVVSGYVPDSDVHLYHLTPDRRTLVLRLSRDDYVIPNEVFTFDSPVLLDQAVEASLRAQVLGSHVDEPNVTGFALQSGLYPLRPEVALALTPQWAGGVYNEVLKKHFSNMALALTPQWAGGVYEPVGPPTVEQTLALALTPQWAGGVYKSVVVQFGPAALNLALTPQWAGGVYAEIAVKYELSMKLNLEPTWAGGTYEQA